MAIDPDKQLPGKPKTANELFLDGLIRHQIGLLRLSGSIRKKVFKLLDATEADMAANIERRIRNHQGFQRTSDTTRLERLLKSIRATRLAAWEQVTRTWFEELTDLAKTEPQFTDGILKTTSPVILETTLPAVQKLSAIVRSRPFEGKTLRQWASNVSRADLSRIEDQIRIGMVQGEDSRQIARRVVGTKSQRGRDGITQTTRRNAEGVTRTAVNAISNFARREFYTENPTVFSEEVYVATLDARTTMICSSLDGRRFPVGRGPIPPLHFNCRSLRVAVLDGKVLGDRPAKPFTEKQLLREFTNQQGIQRVTARGGLPRGTKGRFDAFARTRVRELTGTIPAKVTYQQWLGSQPIQFQNEILGEVKGRLFRRGGLTLDKFVNRNGDELSLRQLVSRERDAFIEAGLDPKDFFG